MLIVEKDGKESIRAVIKKTWMYNDYICIIRLIGNEINYNWYTGYIGVPESSILYKLGYELIAGLGEVYIYGGLTYSDYGYTINAVNSRHYINCRNHWFIGIDFAHARDYIGRSIDTKEEHKWTIEEVEKEVQSLAEQLFKLETDDVFRNKLMIALSGGKNG